jgi:RNA recognition motif-containing protein
MRIFVANFRYGISERELRDAIVEHVQVVHIDLKLDPATGESRGFGWITVRDEDGAAAIEKLQGCTVGGRKLRAEVAISGGARFRTKSVA